MLYSREVVDMLDWYYRDDERNEPKDGATTGEDVKLMNKHDNFDHVFVYGTLLRGQPNHSLLGESFYAGRGATKDRFLMWGVGFPLARLPKESENLAFAGNVVGEVYAVSKAVLSRLDDLEGHPNFYERRFTAISEFSRKEIWMYHWANESGRIAGEVVTPDPITKRLSWVRYRDAEVEHHLRDRRVM